MPLDGQHSSCTHAIVFALHWDDPLYVRDATPFMRSHGLLLIAFACDGVDQFSIYLFLRFVNVYELTLIRWKRQFKCQIILCPWSFALTLTGPKSDFLYLQREDAWANLTEEICASRQAQEGLGHVTIRPRSCDYQALVPWLSGLSHVTKRP